MRTTQALLVMGTIFAASCAKPPKYVAYAPVVATSAATKDALYAAALSAFLDEGVEMSFAQFDAGVIASPWVVDIDAASKTQRASRLRVVVHPGAFEVVITCRGGTEDVKKALDSPERKRPCSDAPERPLELVELQKKIVAALQGAWVAPPRESAVGAQLPAGTPPDSTAE